MGSSRYDHMPGIRLQQCPFWTCTVVRFYFATFSKRGLQKTDNVQRFYMIINWIKKILYNISEEASLRRKMDIRGKAIPISIEDCRLNNFCEKNPFKPLSLEEIDAELEESRECYKRGEGEDFDDALNEISAKYGL